MYKDSVSLKKTAKSRIRKRIRKKISGSPERPRAFIYKSNRHIYIQVIDDQSGKVLASASTLEKEFKEKNKNSKNIDASQTVGKLIASKLKKNDRRWGSSRQETVQDFVVFTMRCSTGFTAGSGPPSWLTPSAFNAA